MTCMLIFIDCKLRLTITRSMPALNWTSLVLGQAIVQNYSPLPFLIVDASNLRFISMW